METKKGIIMKTEKNIAHIMTSTGEFLRVKIDTNKIAPLIGEEYCGVPIDNRFSIPGSNIFRHAIAACLAFCLLSLGGGAYAYYKPVSTIDININPGIELKSNRWDRVIYTQALNEDGKKILNEISLKNKYIDNALILVVDQAKKDNFINEAFASGSKTIDVNVTGKDLNMSYFKKELEKDNLKITIKYNGTSVNSKESYNGGGVTPNDDNSKNNSNKANIQNTENGAANTEYKNSQNSNNQYNNNSSSNNNPKDDVKHYNNGKNNYSNDAKNLDSDHQGNDNKKETNNDKQNSSRENKSEKKNDK